MGRIFSLAVLVLIGAMFLSMCERADMYNLAYNGVPPKHAIYLFATIGTYPGELDGRTGADTICFNEGMASTGITGAGTVRAFLSVSPDDELRFLVPPRYWLYPVIGLAAGQDPAIISTSWAGMLGGSYANAIDVSVGLVSSWWSGSDTDGGLSPLNCSGWHEGAASGMGGLGGGAISSGSAPCDMYYPILCIAY